MAIKSTDASTVKKWLDADEVFLIDVREPSEYESERIIGAHLHPLSQIDHLQIVTPQTKKLVIHCRSGKRSLMACQKLLEQHPDLEVYNLEGGILDWATSGLPVAKGKKNVLPLDQQVQLTVGIILCLASVLAWQVSLWFIMVCAVTGLGLVLAGLTGYCCLGFVLAKMPWNQAGAACNSR